MSATTAGSSPLRFRVWCDVAKAYLQPGRQYVDSNGRYGELHEGSEGYEAYPIFGDAPFLHVEQGTGCTDRKGRSIFVGDIIDNGNKHSPAIAEVCFVQASFRAIHHGSAGPFSMATTQAMIKGEVTVVGNVRENAALLAGGEAKV